MKKIISILCVLCIIIPCNIALAANEYEFTIDEITKEEAYQFADELKRMNTENYDVSNRLIVDTNKNIDYMGAVDAATGIEGLYVLQYPDTETSNEAYDYYNSLSCVNYVEYDTELENSLLCSIDTEDNFDFMPQCISTVNSNIDDAIKLLTKENIEMSEIRIGVIDSGIAKTKITESRLDGGYSYLENHSSDGTQDSQAHGTQVAGTIIINTLNYARLYSYQIFDGTETSSMTTAVSAIYLAVADNCKIINCSFKKMTAKISEKNSIIEAVNYATNRGCICVASAGNDSKDISEIEPYPAMATNCIAVGATTQAKKLTYFSNFGEGVDIYATGTNMTSYDNNGNKVTDWSGTSAAAPVISSVCVLLVTARPDITVDEIKQLLLETGYSTNDENITENHRIIADAYGCVKELLNSELKQVNLDYSVTKNETTSCSDISFSSNDKNVKIFYELGLGSLPETPYKEMIGASQYQYTLDSTINLSKWQMITVAAYAPGKEKKILHFSAPSYSNGSGYRLTQSSLTQQYNKIDRCQIINQKIIEVPETINGRDVQAIGSWCFAGNKTVEKIILPESVKQIDYYAFVNCPNLKEIIAPGVEVCGMYAFYDSENLINVEMPNVTVANTGIFKNCHSLETAKLGTLTEIDNHAFYGCENLKLVKTTADAISFSARTFYNCNDLTIATPKGSAMETFAKNNDIALLGEVIANGGNIRVTDAGLRFGYQYNGEENKNIQEYGFVYNSGETDDLTVDNALKLVANNRIDHGEYTTYNLVFTDVPYTNKAFNQKISAKAYIKIGDEYFYSDVVKHSYNTIANAVLNDETIDSNTKKAVQNILDKVV